MFANVICRITGYGQTGPAASLPGHDIDYCARAGVLGDDLALNAQQVTGVRAERELPVVWAVFKGSALNKLILVPAALLISAVLPVLITPLLMLGGAFLCFEGAEKLAHKFLHGEEEEAEHEAEDEAGQDHSCAGEITGNITALEWVIP